MIGGKAMRVHRFAACSAVLASTIWLGPAAAQAPAAGLIAADDGGAPGYQHSLERSRFSPGAGVADLRRVEEHGIAKVVGPNGVFATDLHNGLTMAIQSGGSDKGQEDKAAAAEHKVGYVLDPEKHNQQVTDYFLGAGIPKDQIGGVHTTTYLSSSGSKNDPKPAPPKIDGYASILERKIGNIRVIDSVAWARLDDEGKVVGEWVYWPAIPAKALADAKRLEGLAEGAGAADFMARLPAGLPRGQVVIRHSSPVAEGPFEAFASYDVIERKTPANMNGGQNLSPKSPGTIVVRHFDVDGVERRLPQERRNRGEDYPSKEKQPAEPPR
jgi:hypothetical protein